MWYGDVDEVGIRQSLSSEGWQMKVGKNEGWQKISTMTLRRAKPNWEDYVATYRIQRPCNTTIKT